MGEGGDYMKSTTTIFFLFNALDGCILHLMVHLWQTHWSNARFFFRFSCRTTLTLEKCQWMLYLYRIHQVPHTSIRAAWFNYINEWMYIQCFFPSLPFLLYNVKLCAMLFSKSANVSNDLLTTKTVADTLEKWNEIKIDTECRKKNTQTQEKEKAIVVRCTFKVGKQPAYQAHGENI